MNAAIVMNLFVLAAIPPLTANQQGMLATADDGGTRDHREAAFWALLENTAQWTGELGDAPIRLNPEFDSMLSEPDAYRGELCAIQGRIEQIEPLLPPYSGVEAWFVRVEGDRPVLVYVDFKGREEARLEFAAGQRIEIIARFYKRYERTADHPGADQQLHAYPVFVGAFPERFVAPAGPGFAAIIVPLVILLGGAFVLVIILVRRSDPARKAAPRPAPKGAPDEGDAELPADPAEALAVLRDRAENAR